MEVERGRKIEDWNKTKEGGSKVGTRHTQVKKRWRERTGRGSSGQTNEGLGDMRD